MSDLWVCSRWKASPKDEEKVQVEDWDDHLWRSKERFGKHDNAAFLLKTHYIPCPAPEQWMRVEVTVFAPILHDAGSEQRFQMQDKAIGMVSFFESGYRVVSLVVERRKS